MKKQRTTSIITNLRCGAFFGVLLFLIVMPRALGERGQQVISRRTPHVEPPSQLDGGSWTLTGSLNTGRFEYTETLLPEGMCLVSGGFNSNNNVPASAELYDPASGSWTATGSLNIARADHTATLLPNGIVLVAGGVGRSGYFAARGQDEPIGGRGDSH